MFFFRSPIKHFVFEAHPYEDKPIYFVCKCLRMIDSEGKRMSKVGKNVTFCRCSLRQFNVIEPYARLLDSQL